MWHQELDSTDIPVDVDLLNQHIAATDVPKDDEGTEEMDEIVNRAKNQKL